jgi:acyl-CoA thioester hydrolase
MPLTYHRTFRIRSYECDVHGRLSNANYLNYVTESSMQSLAACGWLWERLHSLRLAVHLRRCQIQYLQPAIHGDQILLTTWISNPRQASANRHYLLQRQSDSATLAREQTYSVWVRLEDNQPARIPMELIRDTVGMTVESPLH